jgi:DNA-binding NtrC family response regulator
MGGEAEVSHERKIRVLHVDDEEDQLKFTKMFLEELDHGIIVDSVADPEDAIQLQKRNSYDVLLSDYVMMKMTGLTLLQKVREKSDVPFILYTGKGGEEVAESAFKEGADSYMKKEAEPGHYKALSTRIRQVVEKRRTGKAVAEETRAPLLDASRQ